MSDNVYTCEICHNAEGEFIADNNSDKVLTRYCVSCEDTRAERWGCSMVLSEGATCDDGVCGCGGTGVY